MRALKPCDQVVINPLAAFKRSKHQGPPGTRPRAVFFLAVFFLALCGTARGEMSNQIGSAFRLRHEYWQNWKDMDSGQLDNRNFFRFKSSFWDKLRLNEETEFFLKLTNEFKAYTYFAGTTGSVPDKTASKKGYHFDLNEIIIDNFYVAARDFLGAPVDLVLGRQDLVDVYAESFLIQDGTPGDGTRTFYFNAVRGSWRVNEKNTLDLVYIHDPRDEEFFPVINRTMLVRAAAPHLDKAPQSLNTTDEQGVVLDWKNTAIDRLLLEGYYIFKKEDGEGGTGYQVRESDIHAPGAFVKYGFGPYTARGQWAGEFGSYGDAQRLAGGGYLFLDRVFEGARWTPKASAGFIYLSGDDPTTTRNEAWNPLFARRTWFSDVYSLAMASETGITSYWTNLQVWRMGVELHFSAKSRLDLNYNYLRAPEEVAAGAVFSGDDLDRGHLLQGKLNHKFNKSATGYILVDYLVPGRFYKDRDGAFFARTEVQFKF